MNNNRTWLFIISCLFLSWFTIAQEKEEIQTEKSKEPITYALRAGIDLYKPIRSQFDDTYQGLEIVGDLKIKENIYIAAEIGSEKKTTDAQELNFTSSGSYIKIGFDYNMYKNWTGMNNDVYVGMRYGRSIHTQTLNNYLVYITHHYWDTPRTSTGFANGERETLSAGWLEFVFGTKIELNSKLYLGISLRMNRMITNPQPENFGNLYVPGFNKVTDENNFGASFNYTLTYSLPFRFRKSKVPKAF
tara:strand:- start:153 stop:890 length:738 start_codon:yes stop_codon:yes gene_type:complete